MRRALGALVALALAAGAPRPAAAQGPADAFVRRPNPALPAPEPGAGVRVSLMTFGQGDAVWERYGHNAIVVDDPAAGPALAYNWGEFDFRQPNFIRRFLTGDTKYAMRAHSAAEMAEAYARVYNRAVWLQELALTPAQTARLLAHLRATDTEAARYYRYDYYNDNCSTRVRDALDLALGGALRRGLARPDESSSGPTWRSDTRRVNAGDPLIYTGIQLALGRPADAPLTNWQSGYLPLHFRRAIRDVRVPGPGGGLVPLVRAEQEVWGAPGRPPEAARVPSYGAGYLAAGVLAAGLFALAGWTARAGGAAGRLLLGVLGGGWSLVVGVLGTALLLAGTVTKHAAYMGRNLNLLGANPLSLVVCAVLVVALAVRAGDARRRWARRAAGVAGVAAALAVAGGLAVLAAQGSFELFLLLAPAHVALWLALRRVARAPAPT